MKYFFSTDETDNTSITCFPSAIHLLLSCLVVISSNMHFTKLQKKKRRLEKERGEGEGERDNMCDIQHPSRSLLPFRFQTQVEVENFHRPSRHIHISFAFINILPVT